MGSVAAMEMRPRKARVLLRLARTGTSDTAEAQPMIEQR